MVVQYKIKRFGRLPHYPDNRDYDVKKLVEKLGPTKSKSILSALEPKKITLLPKVDNEKYDTPIEDQGYWGSCVFYGGSLSGLEYLHNMLYKKHIRFSKFYNYRMARIMHHWPLDQDTGAYIRSGLGVMVKIGALEREYWPDNDDNNFNRAGEGWEGDFADDYETLKYFRLDYPNTSKDGILGRIKTYLTNKFPVLCGFYCFETIDSDYASRTGNIPFPAQNEGNVGGHAVMILGYDDNREITNPMDQTTTKGAFKFRNSWGTGWGDRGYGYLPYDYLMREEPYLLADEFYSITKAEFLESWQFAE